MTVISNSEFAKLMMMMARPVERFKLIATYDPDGDCIEFIAKPDPFYAERIDDRVTVYYSQETDEVIGSFIKGVSGFCRDVLSALPGFRIEIQNGPVRLQHMFQARLWSGNFQSDELPSLIYRKLIEVSDDAIVEGVEDGLCLA